MSETSNSHPRALVVENDLASRELLARVLRHKGFEAQTAIGAAQAASLLLEAYGPYDLLLIDLNQEQGRRDPVDVRADEGRVVNDEPEETVQHERLAGFAALSHSPAEDDRQGDERQHRRRGEQEPWSETQGRRTEPGGQSNGRRVD